jgi:hypothetical protein
VTVLWDILHLETTYSVYELPSTKDILQLSPIGGNFTKAFKFTIQSVHIHEDYCDDDYIITSGYKIGITESLETITEIISLVGRVADGDNLIEVNFFQGLLEGLLYGDDYDIFAKMLNISRYYCICWYSRNTFKFLLHRRKFKYLRLLIADMEATHDMGPEFYRKCLKFIDNSDYGNLQKIVEEYSEEWDSEYPF